MDDCWFIFNIVVNLVNSLLKQTGLEWFSRRLQRKLVSRLANICNIHGVLWAAMYTCIQRVKRYEYFTYCNSHWRSTNIPSRLGFQFILAKTGKIQVLFLSSYTLPLWSNSCWHDYACVLSRDQDKFVSYFWQRIKFDWSTSVLFIVATKLL